MGNELVVYGSKHCQHCKNARAYLEQKGVMYTYVDVDVVDGVADMLRSNFLTSLPVLIDSLGNSAVGFKRDEIDKIAKGLTKCR